MEVIVKGIGTMEDIEKLKKLQVNLTGRAAMEALRGCRSREFQPHR